MSRAFAPTPLIALLLAPAQAHAEEVDLAMVVKTACAGIRDATAEQPLPRHRLAEAILYGAGYPPSQLIGEEALSRDDYSALVIEAVRTPPAAMHPATKRLIGRALLELSQDLGPESSVTAKARGLRVTSPFPPDTASNRRWLFDSEVSLACMPGKAPPTTVLEEIQPDDMIPRLGLIRKIEDLGTTGSDRKKAESATIGLKRDRAEADDGSHKTSTTLTFDGTLGLRLTPADSTTPIFAFANYTLSQERSKPAAALGPDERRDDKDTNGLWLGVAASDIALPIPASLNAQLGFVSDYAKGSQRGVGALLLTPGWRGVDLGLCKLGALKPNAIGGIQFRTQCMVAGELAYSHVFRTGRADFDKRSDFLSAGVVAGIDLAPPLFDKDGIVSSFRFRYLPTISGRAPDVKRIEAALKYRWWVREATAIDFGFTYKRGEELKTYSDEDVLEMNFGVIF